MVTHPSRAVTCVCFTRAARATGCWMMLDVFGSRFELLIEMASNRFLPPNANSGHVYEVKPISPALGRERKVMFLALKYSQMYDPSRS